MSSHRKPIIGGNWKMNTDLASGAVLAEGLVASLADVAGESADVVICPPFPYLLKIGGMLTKAGSRILLGAQDVYCQPNGAFTGEVSVEMLRDCGVSVVLTGHSERRHVLGEKDGLVNRKTRAALDGGLAAILCVGETLEERESGRTDAVNERQVRAGLEGVTPKQVARVTIAYEPVWAIGTGKTATPANAQDAHEKIRRIVADLYGDAVAGAMRIQYGGSVKPSNARELFSQPDIDGGLIGGASLKVEDFASIVRAAV